eukprot:NODE_172_length_15988_cov_0.603940.p3 type:complete len:374 gc:universal NODE_172_length_15988_cov_0.603940:12850-11729(-)
MQKILNRLGKHSINRLQGKIILDEIQKCCLDLDLCYQLNSLDFPATNCRVELSISKAITIKDSDIISKYDFKDAVRLRPFVMELIKSKIHVNEKSTTLLLVNILGNKRKLPDSEINDEYSPCSIELIVIKDSLYLGARYNKLVRTLSQTPFFIQGKRKGDNSVSEIVGNYFAKLTGSSGFNLVASGREDLDVRCLGRGRPFMLELKDPNDTDLDWDHQQHDFNSKFAGLVQLQYLKAVDKADAHIIKSGEETKCKHYECLVEFDKSLSDDDVAALNRLSLPFVVQQQTPLRVVHRRANLTREKTVFDFKFVDNKLYLKTSAGMYIKEFVHGDCGRSKPSLRDLIKEYCEKKVWCNIADLDIVNVELEWPPVGK